MQVKQQVHLRSENLVSKDFLLDIKEMFEHGKYHANRNNKLDQKLAIHHAHFSIEQILREYAKDNQFSGNLKNIGFEDIIKNIQKKQNIPGYNRLLELNTLRNNIQHHNFVPNIEATNLHIKNAEEFLIFSYKKYFNEDFNSLALEDLIINTDIKKHMTIAKEAIIKNDLITATTNLDHAIAKFKSHIIGYFFEPNGTFMAFNNLTLSDLLTSICLKLIFSGDMNTLKRFAKVPCKLTTQESGFKIEYQTPENQNKTIDELKNDYSEILNIILNYQYKFEVISDSNTISWQK